MSARGRHVQRDQVLRRDPPRVAIELRQFPGFRHRGIVKHRHRFRGNRRTRRPRKSAASRKTIRTKNFIGGEACPAARIMQDPAHHSVKSAARPTPSARPAAATWQFRPRRYSWLRCVSHVSLRPHLLRRRQRLRQRKMRGMLRRPQRVHHQHVHIHHQLAASSSGIRFTSGRYATLRAPGNSNK